MITLRILLFCAALPLAASPAIVTSEFIYETAPYPSCHASTIVETERGELVAAWFGGTAEKHPDVGIWVARFEQGRWTPGVEVANGVQPDGTRHPTWNPVLFQPRGGPLQLYYKVGPSPQTWWGLVRTSADGGRTWSAARRLPQGVLGPIKNKPVQLADGTILAGSSVETPKPFGAADTRALWIAAALGLLLVVLVTALLVRQRLSRATFWMLGLVGWAAAVMPLLFTLNTVLFRRGSEWRVHFERSVDGGETWSTTPPLNDGVKLGAIQPSVLLLDGAAGQTLQAVGRTRQKKVFSIRSDDAGRTWGAMTLLDDVPNPSAGTDAVTLTDGRHLLVCNPVAKGRTPLVVAISRDGRAWQQVVTLEREPGEYSYPAAIQTRDGRVHVTYTWKRQRIKHVVLDPGKS